MYFPNSVKGCQMLNCPCGLHWLAGSLLVLLIRYAAASFVVVKEHLATKMRMVIRATNLNMSWGHNVLATDVSYN